jgi:hypothetical protein
MDEGALLAQHQALAGDPLMARLRGEYLARREAAEAAGRQAEIARLEAEVSHDDRSARPVPSGWPTVREVTRACATPVLVVDY